MALDLDGTLLTDTFSPVLRRVCSHYGWEYTEAFERNTFSQPREKAAAYIRDNYGDLFGPEGAEKPLADMVQNFFRFRSEHVKEHPVRLQPGAEALLKRLAGLDVRLVCYGGMEEDHMRSELGPLAGVFERYVCTNDIRPGVRHIVDEFCPADPSRALFLDDVFSAGVEARNIRAGFIGTPSADPQCHQRRIMETEGLPRLVDELSMIDAALLAEVDARLAAGTFWSPTRAEANQG
ncbi:HAD family hydrolase [Humidesulfovibrio idahonensis]